jgi:hypothetical protein
MVQLIAARHCVTRWVTMRGCTQTFQSGTTHTIEGKTNVKPHVPRKLGGKEESETTGYLFSLLEEAGGSTTIGAGVPVRQDGAASPFHLGM